MSVSKNIIYRKWISLLLLLAPLMLPSRVYAGQIHDMANISNWSVRLDGSGPGWLGDQILTASDLNGDGDKELIVGENHYGTNNGALYIICKSLYSTWPQSGNNAYDLANPSNYNMLIVGATTNSIVAFRHIAMGDLDNDGKNEMVIPARSEAGNGLSNSGSVYIVKGSSLPSCQNTGHTINLSDSSKWYLRIDGPDTMTMLGASGAVLSDFTGDGTLDLAVGATRTNYNSRALSGSVYLFDHALLTNYSGTGNTINLNTHDTFTARFDGPYENAFFSDMMLSSGDFDNDGKYDLIIPESKLSNIYLIKGSQLATYTSTGTVIDLADSSKYYLVIQGATTGDSLGVGVAAGNLISDNGLTDLVINGNTVVNNSRLSSGSVYLIGNNIITSQPNASGNTISMGDTSKFSTRIDGDACTSSCFNLGYIGSIIDDLDGDGQNDLLVSSSFADYNSRNNSGSLHIFSHSFLSQHRDVGSLLDVQDPTNYSLRYDGAEVGDSFSEASVLLLDLNSDGQKDLLAGAYLDDNNSRTNSGSIYIIYNFPHTITITSTSRSGNNATIKGSVSAPNSVTTIVGIQYRVDDNTPSASWAGCTADDGTFDSLGESYTCVVPNTPESNGDHTVFIRAVDANGSYTARSNYQLYRYTNGGDTSSNKAYQIPFMDEPEANGRFVTALNNTTQNVLAMIEAKTFAFNAFLWSEDITANKLGVLPNPLTGAANVAKPANVVAVADGAKIGFTKGEVVYWQVGSIHNIWYKAYDADGGVVNAPKIIPELQNKSSMITLSYKDSDLVPSGQLVSFLPGTLAIAYSIDGVNWHVLPRSVVDTTNHTVATINTLGGYYMLVAKVSPVSRKSDDSSIITSIITSPSLVTPSQQPMLPQPSSLFKRFREFILSFKK